MPRYFFNVRRPERDHRDLEGTDLVDLGDAEREGVASARELVVDALLRGTSLDEALAPVLQIVDGAGEHVMEIPFDRAVRAKMR